MNNKKVIRSINGNWVTAMLDCRMKLHKMKRSQADLDQITAQIKATKHKTDQQKQAILFVYASFASLTPRPPSDTPRRLLSTTGLQGPSQSE